MNIRGRMGIHPPRLRPADRSDMEVMGVSPRMSSFSGLNVASVALQSSAHERTDRGYR